MSFDAIWKHTSLIIICMIINDQIQHILTFRYCFAFLVLLLIRMLHCVAPHLCHPGKFLLASRNYNVVCVLWFFGQNKINNGQFHISFYFFFFFFLLPDKDRALLEHVEPNEIIKCVTDFALQVESEIS